VHAVFYFFAACAVVTAALCILSRTAVSAVLWLVTTMLSLAAIYVLLGAQFVAAIQVLVYAGAVMVLFLFVIMLLNLGTAQSDLRGPSGVAAAIVIAGLLLVELVALWRYTPARLAREVAQTPAFSDPATLFAAGELAR
jgi:NADH-quinone oxidoreductase subunit J